MKKFMYDKIVFFIHNRHIPLVEKMYKILSKKFKKASHQMTRALVLEKMSENLDQQETNISNTP